MAGLREVPRCIFMQDVKFEPQALLQTLQVAGWNATFLLTHGGSGLLAEVTVRPLLLMDVFIIDSIQRVKALDIVVKRLPAVPMSWSYSTQIQT